MSDSSSYMLLAHHEEEEKSNEKQLRDAYYLVQFYMILRKPLSSPNFWSYMIVAIIGTSVGLACGYWLSESTLRVQSEHLLIRNTEVPLPTVTRTLNFNSTFALQPLSEDESEPIWDALIPNGLGYFIDEKFSPQTAISSVFHQLHCLYTLRRAYYSNSSEISPYDFGRDRPEHVAHCFDYLVQIITCMSDTTIEPAVDHEHRFLGYEVQRQCRDFDYLKDWSQQRRAFDASGFLAEAPHF